MRPVRPSGDELLGEIRRAAWNSGVSMLKFVEPIVRHSHPSNFLTQLGRANFPLPQTVERVRALIDGRLIPTKVPRKAKGQRGLDPRLPDGQVRITVDEINFRRTLTERAHAERRPGETLHHAIQRLSAEHLGEAA